MAISEVVSVLNGAIVFVDHDSVHSTLCRTTKQTMDGVLKTTQKRKLPKARFVERVFPPGSELIESEEVMVRLTNDDVVSYF